MLYWAILTAWSNQWRSVRYGRYGSAVGRSAGKKNIWHNCTIFREIEEVDVPLSTKNCGFQKKKKKRSPKKGRKLIWGRKILEPEGAIPQRYATDCTCFGCTAFGAQYLHSLQCTWLHDTTVTPYTNLYFVFNCNGSCHAQRTCKSLDLVDYGWAIGYSWNILWYIVMKGARSEWIKWSWNLEHTKLWKLHCTQNSQVHQLWVRFISSRNSD